MKTLTYLKPFLFVIGLTISLSASAEVVTDACLLENVSAVSPLKENLNYTQGSGRGSDAVFMGAQSHEARVGNLTFSRAAGDEIRFEFTGSGTRVYTLTKAETGIQFKMQIFPENLASGKYGSQTVPGTTRAAVLSYTSRAHATPVRLATFNCF